MAKGDKYFTFPLSILKGLDENPTPFDCLDLAADCGAVNAGKGFLNRNDSETFSEKLEDACDNYGLGDSGSKRWGEYEQFYVVGSRICGLSFGSDYDTKLAASRVCRLIDNERITNPKTPFIRMSSNYLWAAIEQSKFETDPTNVKPEQGISWREFRVLAAILSWKETREGYTTPSVASLQFRSCGFLNGEEFQNAQRIPDHLPKLSPKQIKSTLDTLEALGMFARFRLSTGSKGGRMAYSFKHSRDQLAEVVCSKVNFQDRQKVTQNRAEDQRKCLQLLERAKSKQSPTKEGTKLEVSGGQSTGQSGGQT